jgi:hypothetical protein
MTRHLTDEQVENQVIGTRVQIWNLETHVESLRAGERAHRERIEKLERALAELLVARGRESYQREPYQGPDYASWSVPRLVAQLVEHHKIIEDYQRAKKTNTMQRFVSPSVRRATSPECVTGSVTAGYRWHAITVECAMFDLSNAGFVEWLAVVRCRLVDPSISGSFILEVRA